MKDQPVGPRWMRALCLCVAAVAATPQARAAADPGATDAIPTVEVDGALPDRDQKSYRDLLAAMDVFDRHHALAPGAALRFKVLPRRAGVAMEGLQLKIAGEHTNLAVALAQDQTFALPSDLDAASDDAMLRSNRKDKSLAWRADIRSPGVPPNARRLGDLLLECKVAMAGDLLAYVHHPINMLVVKLADPCRTLPINMFYFADRPVFSITLIAGQRRGVMPAAMLHGPEFPAMPGQEDWPFLRERVYMVKFKALYDQQWPDDTLLRFDYMDDDAPTSAQAANAQPSPGPQP